MKKGQVSILFMALFFLIFAALAVQCTKTDTEQQGATTNTAPQQEATTNTGPQETTQVREMTVTGEIAEGYNNDYVIQGKTPSTMIWTILNPEPKVLDEYVRTGKTVKIDVWIVSGDNVNILTIDGQNYPKTSKK